VKKREAACVAIVFKNAFKKLRKGGMPIKDAMVETGKWYEPLYLG